MDREHESDSSMTMIVTIVYLMFLHLQNVIQFLLVEIHIVVQVIDESWLILAVLIDFGERMRVFISFTFNPVDYIVINWLLLLH